jgi:hypothetical protein
VRKVIRRNSLSVSPPSLSFLPDGGTPTTSHFDAQIGRKRANLRVINRSAKGIADEFFANVARAVQG